MSQEQPKNETEKKEEKKKWAKPVCTRLSVCDNTLFGPPGPGDGGFPYT